MMYWPRYAKSYQTKPRHLRPIFRPFDPFFGQKCQKVNGFDLVTHIGYKKYWSHPLTNSKNIILVLRTCVPLLYLICTESNQDGQVGSGPQKNYKNVEAYDNSFHMQGQPWSKLYFLTLFFKLSHLAFSSKSFLSHSRTVLISFQNRGDWEPLLVGRLRETRSKIY